MEALLDQIKDFAKNADDETRRQIPMALRELAVSLEPPHDLLMRVIYQPFELMVVQIAIDLDLFRLISDRETSITLSEIATVTKADPMLLGRLLRFLASSHFVKEVAEDTYQASHVTKAFTQPGYDNSVWFHFHMYMKLQSATPQLLKDINYQNPTDPTKCSFNKAMDTNDLMFVWFQQHPEYLKHSSRCIERQQDGRKDWTTAIDFKSECNARANGHGTNKEAPLFVDLGGGLGSQCIRFLEAIGDDVPGIAVNEDLQPTLDRAVPHARITNVAHDFFEPQPSSTIGAKFYFLRWIFHDHPDARALIILQHLRNAMASDSVILLNEIVIPSTGAPRQATQLDMTMMIALAAHERTEKMWRDLLGRAGLKIRRLTQLDRILCDSLIEAVPA